MTKEELALKLISQVEGFPTEENIKSVLECFEGIIIGMNNNWEQFLAEETNEAIMRDCLVCPRCRSKIRVERTRSTVYTDLL